MKSKKTVKKIREDSVKNSSFLKFIDTNIDVIIASLHATIENTPSFMNNLDHRFTKSSLIVHALENIDGWDIQSIENEPFDVIFKQDTRVSIKLSRFSQHRSRFGEGHFNSPRDIVLSNLLSSTRKATRPNEWDYLMAIDPQDENSETGLSIGVISFSNFQKKERRDDFLRKRGDQLKFRLQNNEWDYFYRCPFLLTSYNDKKKDKNDIVAVERYRKYLSEIIFGNAIAPTKVLSEIVKNGVHI